MVQLSEASVDIGRIEFVTGCPLVLIVEGEWAVTKYGGHKIWDYGVLFEERWIGRKYLWVVGQIIFCERCVRYGEVI